MARSRGLALDYGRVLPQRYRTNEFRTDDLAGLHQLSGSRRPSPTAMGSRASSSLKTSSPARCSANWNTSFSDHWVAYHVGARFYQRSEVSTVFNYSCNVCGPPAPNAPPGGFPFNLTYSTAAGYPDAEKTYRMPMGKAELDYKIDQDNLLYASVNRSDKGGGWSAAELRLREFQSRVYVLCRRST